MTSEESETRERYRHFYSMPTRWMDNDVYGHVNNVVYYAYIDTAVNRYLIEAGGFDFINGPVVGVAVESMCRYRRSIMYPDELDIGLRVGKLGNSSVRYEIGIFRQGEAPICAHGHFVHVFVERATNRPKPIPAAIRAALARIAVPEQV